MKSIAPFNPPRISVAMLRSPASADSEFGNGKNLSARATESAFGSARPTLAQLMVTILLPPLSAPAAPFWRLRRPLTITPPRRNAAGLPANARNLVAGGNPAIGEADRRPPHPVFRIL